jgi:hypothetical protein
MKQRCVEECEEPSTLTNSAMSCRLATYETSLQISTGTVLLLPHPAMVDFRPRILPTVPADTVPARNSFRRRLCVHCTIRYAMVDLTLFISIIWRGRVVASRRMKYKTGIL